MHLQEFLETKDGQQYSHAEWARQCMVTRGYFSQLVSRKKVPSLALALFIEELTGGKVPCGSWGVSWPPKKDSAPCPSESQTSPAPSP